ncbi:MAG: bifunctional UDP-N-acetylglucosamine diphosphorylase/glucosamine-1-phosphate N-acetyltransferase GlmU [Acidobacteriia bacterium]|nr:bifunctional UDP-N-acetylglucosamine diphosphorylase/glucosamine-1-phosphate N-acetyltransferase GlmU [Terriglobia bacterium]
MSEQVSVAILAAGFGTRMRSRKAKVLHRAGGLTLIEHVVQAAAQVASTPEGIVVVVGHQAEQVQEAVAGSGVRFTVQKEQKGTGHALACCRDLLQPLGGLVLVVYGDCPLLRPETLSALVALQASSHAAATLITTVLADPSGYGRIVRDANGNVAAIVEQKAATPEQRKICEINSGIYCFRGDLLWKHIGELRPNPASGELYLTDLVEILNGHGRRIVPMEVEDSSELLGVNTRVELAEVDRMLRDRKAREMMLAGVTIVRPETVSIDAGVRIGMDTVVEPFVQIQGNTLIGEDCHIGTGSIIRDSILEDGVKVDAFTLIGTSRLDRGAQVGPFARLRLDNHVGSGAHVGNFVELKKVRLGAGAKAMHLAYLGDAAIGEQVNVGAGTITCNYDGRAKHQTRIGKNSFVGSNSTLVAPLEIGEGSYIAAGSVITETVPGDTLALGRARQAMKPGWPSRKRK